MLSHGMGHCGYKLPNLQKVNALVVTDKSSFPEE